MSRLAAAPASAASKPTATSSTRLKSSAAAGAKPSATKSSINAADEGSNAEKKPVRPASKTVISTAPATTRASAPATKAPLSSRPTLSSPSRLKQPTAASKVAVPSIAAAKLDKENHDANEDAASIPVPSSQPNTARSSVAASQRTTPRQSPRLTAALKQKKNAVHAGENGVKAAALASQPVTPALPRITTDDVNALIQTALQQHQHAVQQMLSERDAALQKALDELATLTASVQGLSIQCTAIEQSVEQLAATVADHKTSSDDAIASVQAQVEELTGSHQTSVAELQDFVKLTDTSVENVQHDIAALLDTNGKQKSANELQKQQLDNVSTELKTLQTSLAEQVIAQTTSHATLTESIGNMQQAMADAQTATNQQLLDAQAHVAQLDARLEQLPFKRTTAPTTTTALQADSEPVSDPTKVKSLPYTRSSAEDHVDKKAEPPVDELLDAPQSKEPSTSHDEESKSSNETTHEAKVNNFMASPEDQPIISSYTKSQQRSTSMTYDAGLMPPPATAHRSASVDSNILTTSGPLSTLLNASDKSEWEAAHGLRKEGVRATPLKSERTGGIAFAVNIADASGTGSLRTPTNRRTTIAPKKS